MNEQKYTQVWRDILDNLKVSVSPAIFGTWFTQTHLIRLEDTGKRRIVEIGCNSAYVKSTLETRYFGLIQDSIASYLNSPTDILFTVKNIPQKKVASEISPLFSQGGDKTLNETIAKAYLRSGFTFDNFAVSPSNQMAWAAAEAVSKSLGTAYNPLFIWGGVGVGKTHLMNAIGCLALSQGLGGSVLFCTGEQFTNDIVEGIRNKSTQVVRNKYRKLRVLMVDDIQFIAGKDTVQEEFFHTFNALVSAGSQVIMTSDKPPSEISKLEERLRSRFEAGLIVDIAPPDFELRCAIVQIKAQEKGLELPMDIVSLIAGNLEGARKIEGALVKLSSEVLVKKSNINPELVETILGKSSENGSDKKATADEVISATIKYFSLKKRVLLGQSRARPIARPRQVLMYLLRMELGIPLDEVGRIVGGRDHTTVIHAVNTITHLASTNEVMRGDIKGIKNLIRG